VHDRALKRIIPTEALAAEPYRIFEGVLIEDLQELADDIRGFKVTRVLVAVLLLGCGG
jgi:hypothetical protein